LTKCQDPNLFWTNYHANHKMRVKYQLISYKMWCERLWWHNWKEIGNVSSRSSARKGHSKMRSEADQPVKSASGDWSVFSVLLPWRPSGFRASHMSISCHRESLDSAHQSSGRFYWTIQIEVVPIKTYLNI
jgi:hypothetical protein